MTTARTPSWAECHAAGMTASAAARARGMTTAAACMWARRRRKVWRAVTPEERSASARQRPDPPRLRSLAQRLGRVLQPAEWCDYRSLRLGKYSMAEALAGIGRADLLAAYRVEAPR